MGNRTPCNIYVKLYGKKLIYFETVTINSWFFDKEKTIRTTFVQKNTQTAYEREFCLFTGFLRKLRYNKYLY